MATEPKNSVTCCISLCECASPYLGARDIEMLASATCSEAGFPHFERLYVGSYFCENYFCALTERFHGAVSDFCRQYDLRATLVVPLPAQAQLQRVEECACGALDAFGDVYDEVVANDAAMFHMLAQRTEKRIGLGRLLSKERRDARYPEVALRTARPLPSAETIECVKAARESRPDARPLVELDPVSAVVDASGMTTALPDAEIALHLPLCFATTGRICTAATTRSPDFEGFRPGAPCELQCLDVARTYVTGEGHRYVKHGRTQFFSNPGCQIAGVSDWRVIYAAAYDTMR